MNGVTLELEVTNTKALSKIRKKNIGIKIHFFCSWAGRTRPSQDPVQAQAWPRTLQKVGKLEKHNKN